MIAAAGYLVIGLLSAAMAIPLSGNIPGDLPTDVHSLNSNQAQGLSRRAGWNLFGGSQAQKESSNTRTSMPWKFEFIKGEEGGVLDPAPEGGLANPPAINIVGELLREYSLQKHGTLPRIEAKNHFPYYGIETVYFKVTGPPACKTNCYGYVKSSDHENPMGHITQGDLRLEPKTYPIWTYIPEQPETSTQWTIHIDTLGEEIWLRPKKLYMEYVISVFLREFWLKQPGNLDMSKNHAGMPAFVFEKYLIDDLPETRTTLFKVSGPAECKPTCFGELDTIDAANPSGNTWGILKLPSKVVYDNSDQVQKPTRTTQNTVHPSPLSGFGQKPLASSFDRYTATDCLNTFFKPDSVRLALGAVPGSSFDIAHIYTWPMAEETRPKRFLIHFVLRSDHCGGECTGVVSMSGIAGNICNVHGQIIYKTDGTKGAHIPVPPDCRVHYSP
ncbi:hypothetical protein GGU10DRAFT_79172 [Lentinula aff. detonsa]|uniref:Uncharacterized protein n=1 Tax=Lentinula aff. detonsa TaxID=2804958 RepID=A0AA38NNT2_9AGAR|nr:hypothetical protein GGU10DRAFT_79172 [Lentinula aff. detonsa]